MQLERGKLRVYSQEYLFIFLFLFLRLLFRHLLGVNEMDVLPAAKEFMNSTWLPSDWYLNQDIGYRVLFNSFAGTILHFFSFPAAGIAGRIIVIMLWTAVITLYVRHLGISFAFVIPLLWLFIGEQSIIAGEWMFKALETKTFAYAALLTALLFLYRKKYYPAAFFLGLSVSFHVLVGGYGTLGMLLLIFLERSTFRIDLKKALVSSLVYAAAASIGLYAVYKNIFSHADIDKFRAGMIYVNSRVPHHVLPSYWMQRGDLWKPLLKLLLSLAIIVPAAVRPWNGFVRIFSRFILLSIIFAVAGFGLYVTGHEDLLKFYPFRLPDTLLPVGAYFLFFSFLSRSDVIYGRMLTERLKKIAGIIVSVSLFIIAAILFVLSVERFGKDPEYCLSSRPRGSAKRELYTWIRNNTPKNSVFMISPGESRFYLAAGRAQFVSYKHSPQSEKNILEWYHRLTLLSGKKDDGKSYRLNMNNVLTGYWNISARRLEKIITEYGVDYYIGLPRHDLPYRMVYNKKGLALYDLEAEVK